MRGLGKPSPLGVAVPTDKRHPFLVDQREWDYGARLPRERRGESWSTPDSPESGDSSPWGSPTDTGSLQPIPEAVAWAQRAEAWAQQPPTELERPVSRWSEAVPTGEGVGWRTETAEWRAAEQTARWTQTTEWRSASGTHGWRSTTEAWQTGSGAERLIPPSDPSNPPQTAISSTPWATPDESGADGRVPYGGPQYSGSQYGDSEYGQYSGPEHGGSEYGGSEYGGSEYGGSQYGGPEYGGSQYGGPEYGGPPAPRAPEASWPSATEPSPPSWQTPNPIDGRHLVREDDRAQWRESVAGTSAAAGNGPVGRRRADEGRNTGSGTGWAARSDSDNWAGHTDTGSIPLYETPPPPTWGAAPAAGTWAQAEPDRSSTRRSPEPEQPSWQAPEPERPGWQTPERPGWQTSEPSSRQPAEPDRPRRQHRGPEQTDQPSAAPWHRAGSPAEPAGTTSSWSTPAAPPPTRPSWDTAAGEREPSTPSWSTPPATRRSDENRPGRADENRPSRADENRPSRADENRPSRADENRPSRADEDRPSWARSEAPRRPSEPRTDDGMGRRRWTGRSDTGTDLSGAGSGRYDEDRAAGPPDDNDRSGWARRRRYPDEDRGHRDTGGWRPADDTSGWQRSENTTGWQRAAAADDGPSRHRAPDRRPPQLESGADGGGRRRAVERPREIEGFRHDDENRSGEAAGRRRRDEFGDWRDRAEWRAEPDSGSWNRDDGDDDWRRDPDTGAWQRTRDRLVRPPGDPEAPTNGPGTPPGSTGTRLNRTGSQPGGTGVRPGTSGSRTGTGGSRTGAYGSGPVGSEAGPIDSRSSGRRTPPPPADPWAVAGAPSGRDPYSAPSPADTGGWRTDPDGPRPGGGRRRAEDRDPTGTRLGEGRPVGAAGGAPNSAAPRRPELASRADSEVFRRDDVTAWPDRNGPGANGPDPRGAGGWRRELRAQAHEYPDFSDAPTEIRPNIDPASFGNDPGRGEDPFGGPAAWQRDERERQERGTAPYREGGTGDWRRELADPGGPADGESRRFGPQQFTPFRPTGSARVMPPPDPSAIPTSPPVTARPPMPPGAPASAQPPMPTSPPPAGPRPVSSPVGRARQDALVGAERSAGARWQDPPDTQWPPRDATGSVRTGSYERRASGSLEASPGRSGNLLDPDEDEIEEKTGGPLAAVGYTVIWYGVPVVLFVLYMLVLNSSQQAHALSTLAHAAPQFGLSLVLSMIVAVGLRWASGSWKAASVGLAAAVMGGGLATVLSSAITGNALT